MQKHHGFSGWALFISISAFAIIAILLTPKILQFISGFSDIKDKVEYAGQFAFIETLFSGLAFAGVVVAIELQRRELQMQRNAIEQSIQDAKLESAEKAKRDFESIFFQLLRQQESIRTSISVYRPIVGKGLVEESGRAAIRHLDRVLRENYSIRFDKPDTRDCTMEKWRDITIGVYEDYYEKSLRDIMGHHFRNLYVILKYIKNSSVIQENRAFYTRVLRAQMSHAEMCLVYYNCCSSRGREQMMSLALELRLFDNLDETTLLGGRYLPELTIVDKTP